MLIGSEEFEKIARAIATHMSGILSANAWVVDNTGNLLANKESPVARNGKNHAVDEPGALYLRVPLQLDNREAELIISAPTNGKAISPRVARTLANLIADQMLAVTRLNTRDATKHKFIHDLLRGIETDEAVILRQSHALGMDFTRQHAVLLVDASNHILGSTGAARLAATEPFITKRTQDIINSVVRFFRLPNEDSCAYLGEGEVAVLKASGTHDLTEWASANGECGPVNPTWSSLYALKKASAALLERIKQETATPISIGIGRYHPGINGLSRSYEDARAALSIGRRLHKEARAYCLDELGMAAFIGVSDEKTKVELAHHLLSPLDHESDLLHTLRVFFEENCHPSVTANRLAIHRNTLSYRLDKIAILTGLDARRFNDAVQIQLAVMLRALREPSH
jgi:carbohydrate diacid regulator